MSARPTRQAARARMRAVFEEALDRIIPADETEPLRGGVFREWEDQVAAFGGEVVGCLLEERAALEEAAYREAGELGCCPHCGSDRLYLQRREPKNKTIRTPDGEVVLGEQSVRCRQCGKTFSPQRRDWDLSPGLPLSPRAEQRVARQGAIQTYAQAARALSEDWDTELDGKQIERWATAAGQRLLEQQTIEREAYERGRRPDGPRNDPELLVIGMDGGRVQGREKRGPDGSRWREDKVLTLTSYLPGDPATEQAPQPLVTSYLATMHDSRAFGVLARMEAERRGIRQAHRVVILADAAQWIDTLHQQHFASHVRIIDWYHACERLHDVAKAAYPDQEDRQKQLAEQLETDLWHGRLPRVIQRLKELAERAGPPREHDPTNHPRRTLTQNVTYFQNHRQHMNYPEYRRRGWPIGSGMAESGVKQFNHRVKGTEQFWTEQGIEPILALRALWLSNDQRWNHYWSCQQQLRQAA